MIWNNLERFGTIFKSFETTLSPWTIYNTPERSRAFRNFLLERFGMLLKAASVNSFILLVLVPFSYVIWPMFPSIWSDVSDKRKNTKKTLCFVEMTGKEKLTNTFLSISLPTTCSPHEVFFVWYCKIFLFSYFQTIRI